MAKIEITNRKRFSREYEPWAGVLATVEVEEDDEGQPRWLLNCRNFRVDS
jgi:hypothetical protein